VIAIVIVFVPVVVGGGHVVVVVRKADGQEPLNGHGHHDVDGADLERFSK
jgi:hypothetical protein